MWFAYAFTGAFFKSLAGYYRKKASHVSSIVFTWINCAFVLVALLPFAIFFRLPVLELILQHPWLILGLSLTTSLGLALNIKALGKDELSFVAPLNGFIPVIALLGAWLFIGEVPGLLGIICVLVIFFGTYMMALDPSRVRWYDPITHLAKSPAARLSFVVALLYALSAVFTKSITNLGYDAASILYAADMFSVFMFSYILFTTKRRQIVQVIRDDPVALLGSSLSSLLGSLLHNFAVSLTFASYAIAVRRFDAVFSVLIGWRFLKESNIRNKLIGAVIITIGSALLALCT